MNLPTPEGMTEMGQGPRNVVERMRAELAQRPPVEDTTHDQEEEQ